MPEARLNLAGLAERIDDLYGDALTADAGLVHVAAVWASPAGRLFNLRIGPEAPASETDRFVLDLARVRADAIVSTGAILRAEPALTHVPAATHRAGLLRWREHALGREGPPLLAVLSRGLDIQTIHPAFHDWARPLLFTSHEGARGLAGACRVSGIELCTHEEPSLAALLQMLREERDCRTVLVEAGPSTTRGLYESGEAAGPARVDELMLSVCHARSLPATAVGEPFASVEAIRAAGLALRSERTRKESSGPWSFQRWLVR